MGETSTAIRAIAYSKSNNPANFTEENQLETIFTNDEYATGVGIAIHPVKINYSFYIILEIR